jgi:hypothetical protein
MNIHPTHTIHAIHEKIIKHEDTYFETVAKNNGTSGQGDTCEISLFLIKRNNKKGPDLLDTELKTIAANMASKKALKDDFRPLTMAGGFETTIAGEYGSISKKDKSVRFNRGFAIKYHSRAKKQPKPPKTSKTFKSHKDEQIVSVLTRTNHSIRLTFNGVLVGEWGCAAVEHAVTTKLPNLCIIEAMKLTGGPKDYFNYPDYTYYETIDFQKFWSLFDDGRITIEFRISHKDHGTCFRMKTALLHELYGRAITRSEYEMWLKDNPRVVEDGEYILLAA